MTETPALTTSELDELRRLCEAATAGPWAVEPGALTAGPGEYVIWPQNSIDPDAAETVSAEWGACGIHTEDSTEANLAFIAAARSAVPRLLAEVERLREATRPSVNDDETEASMVHDLGFNAGVAVTEARYAALLARPTSEELKRDFVIIEEFLGDVEHWELADGSTPYIHDAFDALGRLRRLGQDGWQPIETAPRDGTRILIYLPKSLTGPVKEVWWAIEYDGDPKGHWETPIGPGGRGYTILPDAPTRWQPLPSPVDSWPVDHPERAICPECCEDHDYEYDPGRQGHFCKFCDAARPYDWGVT